MSASVDFVRSSGRRAPIEDAYARAVDLAARWISSTTTSTFTEDGYSRSINRWLTWCRDARLDPLEATDRHVSRYRDELLGRAPCAAGQAAPLADSTVRFHLAVVAAFYRWLRRQPDVGQVTANPVDWVQRPPRPERARSEWLSRADALRFLRAAEAEGPRAHALAGMFLFYGQPTSAIARLVGSDVAVDGQDGPTIRTCGRGGVRTTVRLVEPIGDDVLKLARFAGDGPLFPGQRTAAAGRHAIAREIAAINRRADDPICDQHGKPRHITPRLLVATMVMAAARGGARAIDVLELTGLDPIEFSAVQARAGLQAAECVLEYLRTGDSLLPTGAPLEQGHAGDDVVAAPGARRRS